MRCRMSGRKSKSPFVEVVTLDVFNRSVITIVGTREEIEGTFRRGRTSLLKGGNAETFVKQWPKAKEQIRKADEEHGCGPCSGCCFNLDGDVYVWLPEWHAEVFVHEAFHAAELVRKEIDSKCPEVGAYVCAHLYVRVVQEGGRR